MSLFSLYTFLRVVKHTPLSLRGTLLDQACCWTPDCLAIFQWQQWIPDNSSLR